MIRDVVFIGLGVSVALIPILAFAVVLYFATRLLRREVPGSLALAIGCLLSAVGEIATALMFMSAILPNVVGKSGFVLPPLVRGLGYVLAAYGFAQLVRYVLDKNAPTVEPENLPPLKT